MTATPTDDELAAWHDVDYIVTFFRRDDGKVIASLERRNDPTRSSEAAESAFTVEAACAALFDKLRMTHRELGSRPWRSVMEDGGAPLYIWLSRVLGVRRD